MTKNSYMSQQARIAIGTVDVLATHRYHMNPRGNTRRWRPPTDVTDAEKLIIVTVKNIGMDDGEFHIALQHRQFAISGTRDRCSGMHAYHQMEISYGEFSTEIKLPTPVDSEGVEANYADGFLTVRLPKQSRYVPIIEVEQTT